MMIIANIINTFINAKHTACDLIKSTEQPYEGGTINIPNHKWKKGSFQSEFPKINWSWTKIIT